MQFCAAYSYPKQRPLKRHISAPRCVVNVGTGFFLSSEKGPAGNLLRNEKADVVVTYMALSCDTDSHWSDPTRGFNGQVRDDEVAGKGNSLDFGGRLYSSRLGRWNSPDQLAFRYPYVSSYSFGLNNPVLARDPDGNEVFLNTTTEQFLKLNSYLRKESNNSISLTRSTTGMLSVVKTGKLSPSQQSLYNNLNSLCTDRSFLIYAQTTDMGESEQAFTFLDSYDIQDFDLNDHGKLSDAVNANTLSTGFQHYLVEQHIKQNKLGLNGKSTLTGYTDAHIEATRKDFESGGVMYVDAENLKDKTMDGKTYDNIETIKYNVIDKNRKLLGTAIMKQAGQTVMQVKFEKAPNSNKPYEIQNKGEKEVYEKATQPTR